MIDQDLAKLFEIDTKTLKQAVRRNIEHFPSDFIFILNEEESYSLRSQITTLNGEQMGYSKSVILAFTEYGIVMLASIINSYRAIEVNIQVIRAFITMREHLPNYKELECQIKELERFYNLQFNDVYGTLATF